MIYCSLICDTPQLIQPNTYTALRFDIESSDSTNWHQVSNLQDQRSALITPPADFDDQPAGLYAEVFWASATGMTQPPRQYLSRFSRDPFSAEVDSTCTEDRVPTPGQQFLTKSWVIIVRAGQPLAVMVAHDGSGPLAVTLSQFKVWVP